MTELQQINIDLLVPFANHPFKLYEGQRFNDMVESIRESGVLSPIIVRPTDGDNYEILSGHNRVNAAREAGLNEVPSIVKTDLTDEEALFIVTETNLVQRSFADMKHSERAVVISVHYEAMKKKSGYRSDLIEGVEVTSEQVAPRLWTSGKLAEQYGLSADTIKRYLRVNKLISALKERLDNGEFGMVAGVSLSYLRESEQELLNDILGEKGNVGIRQAGRLRKESAERKLKKADIEQILNPEKSDRVRTYKIKSELVSEFFDGGESSECIENTIVEALRAYLNK